MLRPRFIDVDSAFTAAKGTGNRLQPVYYDTGCQFYRELLLRLTTQNDPGAADRFVYA